jgi:hypothetical protein
VLVDELEVDEIRRVCAVRGAVQEAGVDSGRKNIKVKTMKW